jgi:asparaginyl-tRNA synthetase
MKNKRIADDLKEGVIGSELTIKGWVRTRRGSKNVNFIALNDGSTIHNLQVVADVETFGEEIFKSINTGAAIGVSGKLVESAGTGQKVEMKAEKIEIIGYDIGSISKMGGK